MTASDHLLFSECTHSYTRVSGRFQQGVQWHPRRHTMRHENPRETSMRKLGLQNLHFCFKWK